MTTSRFVLIVILTLGLLVASLAAEAQQPAKVWRIGFLGNSTAALEANLVGAFRDGLRDHGYLEGRNALIEYRWAEGQYERFSALIAELIAHPGDIFRLTAFRRAVGHRRRCPFDSRPEGRTCPGDDDG